ncbi:MAG TPA: GTPase Era [Bacteroidales bacterium]|nr:GTPase Era [Bacteroidales bacterium]
MHKAGFVNIIGSPNVGKSTLMNALVGENLSIITRKAQTTRHRIMGIISGEDFQIVYSDTPGILKPHYKLHEAMMKQVATALCDADVLLYVVEAGEKVPEGFDIIPQINKTNVPVLLLINKIDTAESQIVLDCERLWAPLFNNVMVFQISALKKINIKKVFEQVLSLLPESPPYYSKDELTDKPMRFFVSEIIREKVLLFYSKEVPYSVEIYIETYNEEQDIIRIAATLFVARETQKAIILGHKGAGIKRLGTEARKDIENFVGKHVFISLTVKVNDNWRDNETMLQRFGYEF